MLLRKFKSNHAYNFVLFPILGVLFWLRNLIFPQSYLFYPAEKNNLLYFPIHELLQGSVFLQNLVALALFLLMAFIILQINLRYNFIRIRTMIPATLFVIIAAGFTGIHALHPVYFGAVFFLIALYRLLDAFDKPQPYSAAFDTGFFIGVSALFYINVVVLFPAFLIGIGILSRETKWREFLIMIIGILLPFVFAISYAYLTDAVSEFAVILKSNIVTPNNHYSHNIKLLIYSAFLLMLTVLGSVKMIKDYDTKKVSTRKFFIVFFLIFLCSVAGLIFIPAVSQEMLLITVIPVTFLISNFFVFMKSRFWSEFLFLLLFVVVVALQIIS